MKKIVELPAAKRSAGHSDYWIMRGDDMARTYRMLGALLARTDELIEAWGDVLNWSQPPSPGKLGIRWWKHSGKDKMREPVLVVWKRNKLEQFYPVALEVASWTRRVKRGGGFERHEAITREVVHYVAELMRVRALLKSVFAYNPALHDSVLRRHSDVIGFQAARRIDLSATLIASLKSA